MRNVLAASALLAAVLLAGTATAQRVGSLATWKERVLDPASVVLEMYPGAAFNMKFTIDLIRLDETKAKMAAYIIPVDQLEVAAQFFAKQLGTPIDVSEGGTMGQLRIVRAKTDDSKRAGLTIRIENAPWATGKGQILLHYEAPGAGQPAG